MRIESVQKVNCVNENKQFWLALSNRSLFTTSNKRNKEFKKWIHTYSYSKYNRIRPDPDETPCWDKLQEPEANHDGNGSENATKQKV